jgi:ketosteroid isomerase-like protein
VSADPSADARSILHALQAAVDARDEDALVSLFDDPAVLIGTAGDGRDRAGLRRYLAAVVTQPGSLRWEWREIVPFHQAAGTLGFAAFGDVVWSDGGGEQRAAIRLTVLAIQTADGWKMRQFHGSIPATSD